MRKKRVGLAELEKNNLKKKSNERKDSLKRPLTEKLKKPASFLVTGKMDHEKKTTMPCRT